VTAPINPIVCEGACSENADMAWDGNVALGLLLTLRWRSAPPPPRRCCAPGILALRVLAAGAGGVPKIQLCSQVDRRRG
jgi:hypothetical protein